MAVVENVDLDQGNVYFGISDPDADLTVNRSFRIGSTWFNNSNTTTDLWLEVWGIPQ